ncbi:MAG: TIGR03086 family metal-binding protein [Actinomycetota bacterium]|nr:TIGR03086 family metal-binding protein [Actinomycetota bacterium]
MHEVVERFQRAQALFGDRVDAVPPGSWDEPTDLPAWSVRYLVGHLVHEQRWAAPLLAGGTPSELGPQFSEDPLGEDPVAAWEAAADEALTAFAAPEALQGTVVLSYGETPAADYCAEMTADLVVHSWDLAHAIGGVERLDDNLVDWTLAYAEEHLDPAGMLGVFHPAVDVPEDADKQTRMLARYGRSV